MPRFSWFFGTLLLSFAAMILTSNFGRLAETGKFWCCFANAVCNLDQSWFAVCVIWTSVTNDNTCIKYLGSFYRLPILCPNNQQAEQLKTDLAEVSDPFRTIWICLDINRNFFVCQWCFFQLIRRNWCCGKSSSLKHACKCLLQKCWKRSLFLSRSVIGYS